MPETSEFICDLSVVIISRNEEEMIADCIESVLRSIKRCSETGLLNSSEVILSDSASTDQTINIAKKYPIKIVQLNKKWPLSASAGRYIGFQHSQGKYVFFMDGDCVLDENWFCQSIPYLKDENVGGVEGIEAEYLNSKSMFQNEFSNTSEKDSVIETDFVGKAIFRREVLSEVGPYNPYLIGGEDRDISYRIRAAGYNLLKLPHVCITHYWAKKDGNLTLRRYLKSVYAWSKGDGQAFRNSIGNKKMSFWHLSRYINTFYIKVYGSILLFVFFVYGNLLTFVFASQFSYVINFTILVDILLLGLAFLYMYIRKKGNKWDDFLHSFHVIPYTIIRHVGFIVGFLKSPKNPEQYPVDAKIIKSIDNYRV